MKRDSKFNEPLYWAKVFVEGISDAVIILDSSSTVLWWNSLAGNLFGLDDSAHMGESVSCVIDNCEFSQYINDNEAGSIEIPSPVDSNVILSLVLIPSGEICMLVAQDISSRQNVDRMRRDFVANVSHEMRTPLTVVRGYLEMMGSDLAKENPFWGESIKQMLIQMQRLEDLLGDLLLLASLERIHNKNSGFEMLNISKILIPIIDDAKSLSAGRHKFLVEIEKNITLTGNLKELTSCFGNLLANAIRYSPDGGNISVNLGVSDIGAIEFSVQDEGIGIDTKHIPRLTERFYRVDKGRSRSTGGTGLGLSIVKHVLICHGAELEINSEFGVGSIFKCVFL